MSIAGLFNIPEDEQQLAQWSFINAAHHTDIIRVIFQATNQSLSSYVLDPMPVSLRNSNMMQVWLYQHQIMHQEMDVVLGIAGYDLTDVDLSDKGQLAGWIQAHANEHIQAGQILGLG